MPMSYRFMRILVFFDLPVETAAQRRAYTHFRKFLIRSGFIMMQESVYTKLAPNATVAESIQANVRKNKPQEGLVQMLTVTEKQFNRMEILVGQRQTEILEDDRKLVIL